MITGHRPAGGRRAGRRAGARVVGQYVDETGEYGGAVLAGVEQPAHPPGGEFGPVGDRRVRVRPAGAVARGEPVPDEPGQYGRDGRVRPAAAERAAYLGGGHGGACLGQHLPDPVGQSGRAVVCPVAHRPPPRNYDSECSSSVYDTQL
ncbi:hypothetical protein GCM10022220_01380 [Actinocatenispora rupis]|uniref:Uncharacterized protein n=1 Tax=Actinocatenispora rupis TaxID=519421 RepID=A0A8J3JDZ7_9ACTN|nr:hypothetical protein Aru02nite_50920 [Actinocatenispora rupis]